MVFVCYKPTADVEPRLSVGTNPSVNTFDAHGEFAGGWGGQI